MTRFREKPDKATAEAFLAAGNFVWNAGIFVWRAETILDELASAPAESGERSRADLQSTRHAGRGRDSGQAVSRHSNGYRSTRPSWNTRRDVRVLEVPYRWNDVGDWRALATLLERDSSGNAIQGSVVACDTAGSIIISDDGGLVATLGVENLVVVHSGKATLVARKDQLDKLKALVEGLVEAGYGSFL